MDGEAVVGGPGLGVGEAREADGGEFCEAEEDGEAFGGWREVGEEGGAWRVEARGGHCVDGVSGEKLDWTAGFGVDAQLRSSLMSG